MKELRGLRGRLTIALAAVSALTVVLVGALLLVPLDRKLREDSLASLTQTARSTKTSLTGLDAGNARALGQAVNGVRRRTGAEAFILHADGSIAAASEAEEPSERFPQVARALAQNRVITTVTEGEAQTVLPFEAASERLALVLRRPLRTVGAAQDVVQRSLLAAGLVAVAIAAVLGALLATGMARRLITLRELAQRLSETGAAPDVPPDRKQDEIGDLARAFATMQRQLERQEQARRTFVSTASHELRTPLSSLRLMLGGAQEVLGDHPPDISEVRDQLDRALGQTERLSKLAAELLDLSRIDAGVPLREEPIELATLARSIVGELAPPEQLAIGVRGGAAWACADPGSVARIVRILIDNALRHGASGGRIEVDVTADADWARVTVTDEGPGIADDDAERIFARFERGTQTHADSGFGLGLAIGRELAEQMGGHLRLQSGCPRAAFTVELPPSAEAGEPV